MTGATSKCICGVQPPENDLTTIFVCYFLHVRSSVLPGSLNCIVGLKCFCEKNIDKKLFQGKNRYCDVLDKGNLNSRAKPKTKMQ